MSTKTKKSKWHDRLAALNDRWGDAVEEAQNLGQKDEVDDGKYKFRLTDGKIVEVDGTVEDRKGKKKNIKELKLVTDWTITKGEEKGKTVSDWRSLEREDSLKWLAVFFAALGVEDLDELDITEIERIVKTLLKERDTFVGRLKTGDTGFQNLRILKKLDDDEGGDDDDEDDDTDSDNDDEDDDEKPRKKGKKGKKSKKDDDDDDDSSDDDDDDSSDDDDDDSDDEDDDDSDDEDDKKKSKKKGKKSDDGDDDEDSDDDEPKKGKKGKKKSKSDDDDDDSQDFDPDELPGMKCKFKHKGESYKGKIIKVDAENEKVKVKSSDGEVFTVKLSAVDVVATAK